MAGLIVKPRARILHGHDWVYSGEILKAFGNPVTGDVVSIKDGRDRMLGSAIYNRDSQIVARRFSRQRQGLDEEFFARRLAQAKAYRDAATIGEIAEARREIFSDSDGLPGLIVDRYAGILVVQILTAGMDRVRDAIIAALRAVYVPDAIIERSDAASRKSEGLELKTEVAFGAPPPSVEVRIGDCRFDVPIGDGHKTGAYLDQAENYRAVAARARGRSVLDCFSYRGGFAIHCAKAGAGLVQAVESSAEHCESIRINAAKNGVAVDVIEANAFDHLKQEARRGTKWDMIILDPPSFTKNRASTPDALRGYKEVHLRAFEMLKPGGLLATFSCSYHVDSETLIEVARAALVDTRSSARVIDQYRQAADHPELALLRETGYLRGWLLEMMPGR